MQTIWSRVAQTKCCCRCPQCLSSAKAISRRAATSVPRRIPRFFTTSTFAYTSIFAVAATYDAGNKQERREQWDRAIEDVKQELQQGVPSKQAGRSDNVDIEHVSASVGYQPLERAVDGDLDADSGGASPVPDKIVDSESDTISTVFRPFELGVAPDVNGDLDAGSEDASPAYQHVKPVPDEIVDPEGDGYPAVCRPLKPGMDEESERSDATNAKITYFYDGPEGYDDMFRYIDPRESKKILWPSNTGRQLNHRRLPPQSIYGVDETFEGKWRGNPWTSKKLAVAQLAMDNLQLKVFLRLQQRGWSEEAAEAVPTSYAEHILQSPQEMESQLEGVRNLAHEVVDQDTWLENYQPPKDYQSLCTFGPDSSVYTIDDADRLTIAVLDLFRTYSRYEISKPALLASIMHRISICPAPPDVNVYNALLQGFTQVKEHHIVSEVIGAFRRSNMRPNEVTLTMILRHYVNMNNPDKFAHWVGLLRGEGLGLSLVRPNIPQSEASEGRMKPHTNHPEKFIQLPHPTPMVFAAVISGVLEFAGFDNAMRVCDTMAAQGWGLCMSGMAPLLNVCANRGDWEAGMRIWSGVQSLVNKSRKTRNGVTYTERIARETFAAMLRLCTVCEQRETYRQVHKQAEHMWKSRLAMMWQMIGQQDRLAQWSPWTTSQRASTSARDAEEFAATNGGFDAAALRRTAAESDRTKGMNPPFENLD